jgi:dihydroorotate dehydrogenase (fumarate)/dihydroorotate dehydrogenase
MLFQGDAERLHNAAIRAGEHLGKSRALCSVLSHRYTVSDPRLASEVCGIRFPNPVGLAAGYDKSGRALPALAALGFGFLEIGSVSAGPSDGNPRPRLWRLPDERAIVVNYGLPNDGADAVAERLATLTLPVPLGINIVKTNRLCAEPTEAILEDYLQSVRVLQNTANYLVLNLSCPNTETGRDFFGDRAHLRELLQRVQALDLSRPLFLKVSPLGGVATIERLLEAVEGFDCVSGFIFNLPPGKPPELDLRPQDFSAMPGAVAGKPVERMINTAIGELYRRMDRRRYHIVAAGGVFSAEDAYRKLCLGASLVQLLTALVFEGPSIVRTINRGLLDLLHRDGLANIADAIGADNQ